MTASRSAIPAERYRDRMAAARELAGAAGFAGLLVGVGADMRYLAGYPAMPLERLTMLVIPTAGGWALVAPRLEKSQWQTISWTADADGKQIGPVTLRVYVGGQ